MKGAGTQYYRIYCDIITDIYNGRRKRGDLLPSLDNLCQMYGVGRTTVRSALKLLEDNDYIERHGQHQLPVISFDWNDSYKRNKYIIQLAQRKESIYEIYDFFAIIMPDLFSKAVSLMSKEQRDEIIDMINKFLKDKTIITEEVAQEFINIYFFALSVLNNDLFENLFKAMYYHIQIPLEEKTYNHLNFLVRMKIIRGIFKTFEMLIKLENYKVLKKEIYFFIKNIKMNNIDYLETICKDVQVDDIIEFQWISHKKQNIDYILIFMQILRLINDGCYQEGDILPSYLKLSKQMNVSQKTTRKAIQLLNKWEIVKTVNGIGTVINRVDNTQKQKLLDSEKVIVHIDTFFQALQIFILICQPIVYNSVNTLTDESIELLKKRINDNQSQAFNKIVEFLFYHFHSSSMQSIYEQLRVILMWSQLLMYCGFNACDYGLYESDLLQFINEKNGNKASQEIYHYSIQYFHYAKEFWEEHGKTVTVLEIKD